MTQWLLTPEGAEVFLVALGASEMRAVWGALLDERRRTEAERDTLPPMDGHEPRAARVLALNIRVAWLTALIDDFDPARVRGLGIAAEGGPREMGPEGATRPAGKEGP